MSQTAIAPTEERQGFRYRTLVDEVLWERLVGRIIQDEEIERAEAERIMDAALGFIKLCAEHPGNGFAPTPLVDIGWHTMILYTRHYDALCRRLAGRFIHHDPNDDPAVESSSGSAGTTVTFMETHGIEFDPVMWTVGQADCGNNACGPDCTPDGGDARCGSSQ